MINIQELLQNDPYQSHKNTRKDFLKLIKDLTLHHKKNSIEYKKIFNFFNYNLSKIHSVDDIPYIPINLFKSKDLISIKKKNINKTLLSSGTSNTALSKIYLDKENAYNQVKVLKKIIESLLGTTRLPMLVIEQKPDNNSREKFNARKAAIYGFSIFGKEQTFFLNEKGKINYKEVNNFLKKYKDNKFLIFGFTSFIYENLILKLSTEFLEGDFKNGVLLHGGGWKKMNDIKISNELFKFKLQNKLNLKEIYNYYGLVEQTGSIFIECKKCGSFLSSNFSDVIVRDKYFNKVKDGQKGLVQLLSLLPTSYPGHSILTEDIGEIVPRHKIKCNLDAKHFLIHGRLENSEVRGCSDV